MGTRNLTVRGHTDGFGCQYNAILSGVAFCNNRSKYRFIHSPMRSVSHGWEATEATHKLNEFIGIPDTCANRRIHVKLSHVAKVFKNPTCFYNTPTLDLIRSYYYSTQKPASRPEEIVVHIRRGDVGRHRSGDRRRRFITNSWYNRIIPLVAEKYPDHYRIAIYSEGEPQNFASIIEGWSSDLTERLSFRLATDWIADQENCLMSTFHNMVSAKVLIMSKSGLAYSAGILNDNDVYFVRSPAIGQTAPLTNWIRTSWGG